MDQKVIILGAGGHAKSIANIISKNGDVVYGFLDDNVPVNTPILKTIGAEVIGNLEDVVKFHKEGMQFIIGIGNNTLRRKVAEKYSDLNYYTAIHPTSNIACEVNIAPGTAIMANTSINAGAKIGKHSIVNTGAIVEHDNIIQDYVHLSPGVILSGTVNVGENTHLGTGVKVKNNISIASDVVVGVGGVVVKDIMDSGTYIGLPAKKMLKI